MTLRKYTILPCTVCLPACLSVCLSVYLNLCICLSVLLTLRLNISVCLSYSFCQSDFLDRSVCLSGSLQFPLIQVFPRFALTWPTYVCFWTPCSKFCWRLYINRIFWLQLQETPYVNHFLRMHQSFVTSKVTECENVSLFIFANITRSGKTIYECDVNRTLDV